MSAFQYCQFLGNLSLQISACIPNFLITEYFLNYEETGQEVAVHPFEVENSYIRLPEAPGLGIELKENELLKRPYQQYPPRSLRDYHEENP
jgi:galactonate dehydratase